MVHGFVRGVLQYSLHSRNINTSTTVQVFTHTCFYAYYRVIQELDNIVTTDDKLPVKGDKKDDTTHHEQHNTTTQQLPRSYHTSTLAEGGADY